jgi:cytochrome c peroxidase
MSSRLGVVLGALALGVIGCGASSEAPGGAGADGAGLGGAAGGGGQPVSHAGTGGIYPVTGGASGQGESAGGGYDWKLPEGFPVPKVPADNPMTEEKVTLGRRLFYDKRLSLNQTQSCASCHKQELAFTDGRAQGLGSTGEMHPRGPMSLANVAYAPALTWANPLQKTLEQQALAPMFGEHPVELGLVGHEDELLDRLKAEPIYQQLMPAAFPGDDAPFSVLHVTQALASFERTLLSGNAPFDRAARGDATAMSDAARRGQKMFFSERLECFHCHGSFLLNDSLAYEGKPITESFFHNTGLYNLDSQGAYPPDNTGIHAITHIDSDMGRFKAPTLRNIALTGPYMHDGSAATLDDVIAHYAAGGRTITSGPYAGVGSKNIYKSEFLIGFQLSDSEHADLVAFLESLTDDEFLHDPRFSDPW